MAEKPGPLPGGRRPTESWESLIDRKIRTGIESGDFDDLPGTGKPLQQDDDPLEDPSWTMARRMLKAAGFSHPAIESKKAIEEDIEKGRRRLRTRRASVADIEAWCREINRRIADHNLRWSQAVIHLRPLDPQAECSAAGGHAEIG